MSEICNFYVYSIGNKKDIDDLNELFLNNEYSYFLKNDFVKSLDLYDESVFNQKDKNVFFELEGVRNKAAEDNNIQAIILLEDENLKKEYFQNIPKTKHLFRIFDYDCSKKLKEVSKDVFISTTDGACAWNVCNCMTDSIDSYYIDAKHHFPKNIFMGTCLNDFAEEHPNLKFVILSDPSGFTLCSEGYQSYSEFYLYMDGKLKESKTEDVVMKDIDEPTSCLVFPKWFDSGIDYIDESYVFGKLGCKESEYEKYLELI